jgi:phage tail sheath gpL-like
MAISFNGIPTTLRVPFVYVEFDNSKAQQGAAIQPYQTLLIGQKLTAGTATALEPVIVSSEAQAIKLFGAGSILHGMVKSYLENDKVTKLVVIPQDDDGSGVAATGSFDITGTATEDGVLYAYVGAERYTVVVASGDTADDVGAALAAEITADDERYVDAVNASGVVTGTARNKGEAANLLPLHVNYQVTEETPAGLTVGITAMNGGAVNPDVDDVVAVMPDEQFNLISHPYTDTANLAILDQELEDRFSPLRQIDGNAISSYDGTLGALSTYGSALNSKHLDVAANASIHAPWEYAAAYTGQVSKAAQADPARPFQTLQVQGISPKKESDRFSLTERNTLLFDGIATSTVDSGGAVRIERAITTWQTNDAGAPDTSYLDLNTKLTLSYLRYSWRVRMQQRYPRHKLANSGTRFGAGQAVITPLVGKAEAVMLFAEWEELGLVEGIDQFKRDLIVERNKQDPNRLDFLMPPDLLNQLRVVGTSIQFLL